MTRKRRNGISGRKVTRTQALKGLGDPASWKAEATALEGKFRAKPTSGAPKIRTFELSPRILRSLNRIKVLPDQTRLMTDDTLLKVAGIGTRSLSEIRNKVGKNSRRTRTSS